MNEIEVVIPLTRYTRSSIPSGLLEWLVVEYITSGLNTPELENYSNLDMILFRESTYDEIYDLILQCGETDTVDEKAANIMQVTEAMIVLKQIAGDLDSFLLTDTAIQLAERTQQGDIHLASIYSLSDNSVLLHFTKWI